MRTFLAVVVLFVLLVAVAGGLALWGFSIWNSQPPPPELISRTREEAGAVLPGSTAMTITINGRTVRIGNDGKGSVDSVKGSGKLASESRDLGGFTALRLELPAEVTVTAGEKSRCTISADDNLLPLILTEVSDHTLRIAAGKGFTTGQKLTVAVETPFVNEVEAAGSGNLVIDGTVKDRLALKISGASDVTVRGKVAELDAAISGSGDLEAGGLEAAKVKIDITGSGDAQVRATRELKAKVSGSGTVTYAGNPLSVETETSGTGTIQVAD